MVDGGWFDELEAMARKIRRSKLPFGGIQLICCGDFLQLPPVSKGDDIKSYAFQARTWKTCMVNCACFSDFGGAVILSTAAAPEDSSLPAPRAHAVWWDSTLSSAVLPCGITGVLVVCLAGIELQQVRRQSDPTFIEMLRRVRLGECTPDDVDLVCLGATPQSIEPRSGWGLLA